MISIYNLYSEIEKCHLCPNMDKEKVIRKIEFVNQKSDIFIISQALARNQLRLSGINFFDALGKPGSSGNTESTTVRIFCHIIAMRAA